MSTVRDAERKNVIYGLFHIDDPDTVRYVGQTRKSARTRFTAHRTASLNPNAKHDYDVPVHRWMRKYGVENISYRILEAVDNPDDLDEREAYWISSLGTLTSTSSSGLNVSPGGGSMTGVRHTTKTKEALRKQRQALTVEQATDIKLRIWNGEVLKAIAESLDISESIVRLISQNKTYLEAPWPIGPRRQSEYEKNVAKNAALVMSDPDVYARHHDALVKAWTPERKAAMSAKMRESHPMSGRKQSEEMRRAASLRESALTVDEIREVRRLRSEEGMKYKEIQAALTTKVSIGTIGNIIRGDYYTLID